MGPKSIHTMKNTILKIIGIGLVIFVGFISVKTIINLKTENERLSSNFEIISSRADKLYIENSSYKVADSLNAVKINNLSFTVKELRAFREDDFRLIEQLKVDKHGLQNLVTTKTKTITSLKASLVDTVFVVNSVKVQAKAFNYKSKYTDVEGLIVKDSVSLNIENREELKVVGHVAQKRFLWIKLSIKYFGYKEKQVEVISLNPNTKIIDVEFINVKE